MRHGLESIKSVLAHQHVRGGRRVLPRYLLTVLASFTAGTATLWLLTDKAKLFYLLSGAIGAFVSLVVDFNLNEKWTFSQSHDGDFTTLSLPKRILKYISSKFIGLAIAYAVLALGTEVFKIHYLISNLAGIALSFVWNFTLSYSWVWAKRRSSATD